MTPIMILMHFSLAIGACAWSTIDAQYSIMTPRILSALELEPPFSDADIWELESLGVYETRSVPLYLKHLSNPNNVGDTSRVLGVMLNIKSHASLFNPCAVRGLAHEKELHTSLAYLITFGTQNQARAVAAVLLNDDFKDNFPELVLRCLKKVGGKDELPILAKYSARNFARNRMPLLVVETSECINAIESRLEAEAMAAANKK